jgi:uncharacterized membrane protein SpoIIM required for sporulation
MFIFGLTAGASALKSESDITDKIILLFENYISQKSGQGMLENFCNSLTVNALFFSINFLFAFSLIGIPFIITLPMLKGFGLGCFCGYLYSTFRLTGLGYGILMVYPGAIVSAIVFILACNDSCEYSRNAFRKSIKGKGEFEKDDFFSVIEERAHTWEITVEFYPMSRYGKGFFAKFLRLFMKK